MIWELRHALRSLTRAPGHAALIVATLASGMGATTTIYSVVLGVLLTPLPFPDHDRLLMLWQRAPGVGVTEDWFSPAQYFDLAEGVPSFEHVAAAFGVEMTLSGDRAEPERIGALLATSSLHEVLGVEPVLGRRLRPGDDEPGSPRKVLLGHALFERRYGGDATVVGRTMRLDGAELEIIGVMPPEQRFDADLIPTLITVPVFDIVASLPLEDSGKTTHGSENYNVLAKMRERATTQQVESELLVMAEQFRLDPDSLAAGLDAGAGFRIGFVSLLDQVSGTVRAPLLVLLSSTAMLLLVACANVANLLLARSTAGRQATAVRLALGAGRGRLLARSMIESALLASAGGLAGVGIAAVAVGALRRLGPAELPRLHQVQIDPGVLGFALASGVVVTLAAGSAPALRNMWLEPGRALATGNSRSLTSSAFRRRGSRVMVALQVALSLVLVTSAALLGRTLINLRAVDPGFAPGGALSFRISLVGDPYRETEARRLFFRQLWDDLRGRASISAAGGTSLLPLTRGFAWTDFAVEGQEVIDARDRIVADVMTVTDGYFEAMDIPLLAGRSFTAADGAEPSVVMIERTLAERFWGVGAAVGKWVENDIRGRSTIVGVVDAVKHYGLDADTRMAVFYPHAAFANRTLYGVARTSGDPAALSSTVTSAVGALDPTLPVYAVRTLPDRVRDSLARQRALVALLNLFSSVALLLATVGLYGVLSYAVASQTREIGIRRSLGAQRRHLYRLVLGSAAAVIGTGLVVGAAASLVASRSLEGLLFGVAPGDPMSLALAVLIVAGVGGLAAWLPARRAAHVDPLLALRAD